MARMRPARMVRGTPSGAQKNGHPLGSRPRGVHLLSALGLAQPAAEQAADLGYHATGVLVLAVVQPVPVMREPQVQADTVECGIHAMQPLQAGATAPGLGLEQALLDVQRGIEQAFGHRVPVGPRKALALGQQPGKQVVGTGKDE